MLFCEKLLEYVDHRLQPSQNLNIRYMESVKIREKKCASEVFLANLKIMTTSSDMKKKSPFPTSNSRLAYPSCFHCLPMVKFCFESQPRLGQQNQVTLRCIPNQLLFVPVLLGTNQSIPCPILQQWLQVTWRRLGFFGGMLLLAGVRRDGQWLKLQESFHGNSYWKEVGVGVSWGGGDQKTSSLEVALAGVRAWKNRPALDDSGCFSNWYGIVRSSKTTRVCRVWKACDWTLRSGASTLAIRVPWVSQIVDSQPSPSPSTEGHPNAPCNNSFFKAGSTWHVCHVPVRMSFANLVQNQGTQPPKTYIFMYHLWHVSR